MTEIPIFRSLYEYENFPLESCREQEIKRTVSLLKNHPIVFFWGPSGNGKTGMGRELKGHLSNTQFILSGQITYPDLKVLPPYDSSISTLSHYIVVDEVKIPDENTLNLILNYISNGKKFIFLFHEPKTRFIYYKKYHKRFEPYINELIKLYPEAPWIYLSKWNTKRSTPVTHDKS